MKRKVKDAPEGAPGAVLDSKSPMVEPQHEVECYTHQITSLSASVAESLSAATATANPPDKMCNKVIEAIAIGSILLLIS